MTPPPPWQLATQPVEADGTLTFTLTKTGETGLDTTVDYATADGTAKSGSDFTAASGTLTLLPGETSATVTVTIAVDTVVENGEVFTVQLSNPANATLGDGEAVGLIHSGEAELPLSLLAARAGELGFIVDGEINANDLGYRVYSAGDMNGDGIDDFVVSAQSFQVSTSFPGSIYVIYGGTDLHHDGVFDVAAITNGVVGEGDGTLGFRFTGSVATCCEFVGFYGLAGVGDVNGDGYDDIAVGTTGAGAGYTYTGRIYLIFGGHGDIIGNSLSASADIINGNGTLGIAINGGSYDSLGRGVSPLGDVNGDGLADFSVAAKYADRDDAQDFDEGAVYVIFGGTHLGSTAVLSTDDLGSPSFPGLILMGEAGIYDALRHAGGVGDVNGDGYADVVIGVPDANLGGSERGRAYVVFGGPNVADLSPLDLADISGGDGSLGFVVDGAVNDDEVGSWVTGGQDINGDGVDDLILTGDNLTNQATKARFT